MKKKVKGRTDTALEDLLLQRHHAPVL